MSRPDPFAELAGYYDPLMREVDYDRWLVVTSLLAEALPTPDFLHIDLACGTGRLLKRLVQHGWRSFGVDVSRAMLREARKGPFAPPVAAADVTALPLARRFHYATCVFDSFNFLVEVEAFRQALASVAGVLLEEGVLYFDAVTERMVTEHFADQTWTEDNGPFSTTWEGRYDRGTRIAELDIRVDTGPAHRLRERVFSRGEVIEAIEAAGLTLLGEFDAETWKRPTRRSIRVDYVASRNPSRDTYRRFKRVHAQIRKSLSR